MERLNPCPHAALDSYLPNVEGQCDGIKEVGVGTSRVNPEVPQDGEEQGAGDHDTAEDKDVSQDCKDRRPVSPLLIPFGTFPCCDAPGGWADPGGAWGSSKAEPALRPPALLEPLGCQEANLRPLSPCLPMPKAGGRS